MKILKAIILGLIQGITEFLPISSSGHLIIAERIMGLSNDLVFSLFLHLATLLAVIMHYYEDIIFIIKNPRSKLAKSFYASFLPTMILAFLFKNIIEENVLVNYIGFFFVLTSIIIFLPRITNKRANFGLGVKTGIITGIAQGLACFPGISRSGATVTTAVMCGAERKDAVKLSFLCSIPIIIGGALYELLFSSRMAIASIFGLPMILGFIAAFASGIVAIKIVEKLAVNKKFHYFSYYLFVVGVILIINSFVCFM